MNISLGRIHKKKTQRRSAVASASRQANEPKKNLARNIQLVHGLYDSPPISFLAMNFPFSSLECDFRENYIHINIYEIAVKIERTEEKS